VKLHYAIDFANITSHARRWQW